MSIPQNYKFDCMPIQIYLYFKNYLFSVISVFTLALVNHIISIRHSRVIPTRPLPIFTLFFQASYDICSNIDSQPLSQVSVCKFIEQTDNTVVPCHFYFSSVSLPIIFPWQCLCCSSHYVLDKTLNIYRDALGP